MQCNSAELASGGSLTYVIEKPVAGWNVAKATSSNAETQQVLAGIVPAVFRVGPDLVPALNSDLMVSARQVRDHPQTLEYRVRPNAVWSDGRPIGVDDFVYAWKTSSPTRCPDCAAASSAGYSRIATVTGSDDGRTVTVTMAKPFADWQVMFRALYPAHLAAGRADLSTPAGLASSFNGYFDRTPPRWSGRPYLIDHVERDSAVVEKPNPRWYGARPRLDRLVFRTIVDQSAEVLALANGEVQVIHPQPDAGIVQRVASIRGVSTFLGAGLTTEHLDLNSRRPVLRDVALRRAIFTAIDRSQILRRTVGQFQPHAVLLDNRIFVPGQPGYRDTLTASGQGGGDVTKATEFLRAAGYTGIGTKLRTRDGETVSLGCYYTRGTTVREQTCELVQAQLGRLGIAVPIVPVDQLSQTLSSGDFDLIDFATVGSPFVLRSAQSRFTPHGGSNASGIDDPAASALIDQALQAVDPATARSLLDRADELITADAVELPLYQKPGLLALSNAVANVRPNGVDVGPAYDVGEWGLRAK
jgi:peptide/nickel transport system substrate-binding protein